VEPLATPPSPAAAPRSLGAVLDAAFEVVRRHWLLLVGLSALLYVPASFAERALPEPGAGSLPELAPWMAVALLLAVLALPVVVAAVTDACGDLLRGRSTDAGRAVRRGLALALPLTGTYLVMGLVVMAALVPLALVVALWSSLGLLRVPAVLAGVALPFAVLMRFSLLTQVAVLEEAFGPRALARASRLIEGQVLRVFGILAVAGLLAGLLGGAAGLALGAIPLIGPVATGLVQALGFAYTSAVGVVVYEDVRSRRDQAPLPPPP